MSFNVCHSPAFSANCPHYKIRNTPPKHDQCRNYTAATCQLHTIQPVAAVLAHTQACSYIPLNSARMFIVSCTHRTSFFAVQHLTANDGYRRFRVFVRIRMVPRIGPRAGGFFALGVRRTGFTGSSAAGASNAPDANNDANGMPLCFTYAGCGMGFLPGLLYFTTRPFTGIVFPPAVQDPAAFKIAAPASFPKILPIFCVIWCPRHYM
jgi:hypothetical protein